MSFRKLPLLLTLLAAPAFADGVDDPNFYRDFDTKPCSYDLGDHYVCVDPLDRTALQHVDDFNGEHRPPEAAQVPEPGALLLLGLALTGLAAAKRNHL